MSTYRMLMLVAEKDGVVKDVIAHYTTVKGWEVTVIQNGLDAIGMAKQSTPDIIVSDLLLPKLDGIRVCKILKKDKLTSTIPFVVLSLVDAENKALEAGADAFILRPVKSSDIIDTIDRILMDYDHNAREASC